MEGAILIPERDPLDERMLFRLLFERSPIGIIISRFDGIIEHVNPAICETLGFSERELLRPSKVFIHPDEFDLDTSICKQLKDPSVNLLTLERRFIRKDGTVLYALIKISAQRGEKGTLTRIISQVVDLTALRERDKRIHELAYSDPLTGLPNRRALIETIDDWIMKHPLEPRRFAILFLDLDRFKVINDVLGHNIGDQVLLAVVRRLKSLHHGANVLARVGGDEFALLVEAPGTGTVEAMVERIRQVLRQPFDVEGRSLSVGVSIGISCFPDDARSRSELMRNADVALHRAKLDMTGSQRYAPGLNRYTEDWLTVESELQQSINAGAFEIFVQPVVRSTTRETVYHEALLRWRHRGELKSPNAFIPIAEAGGLIIDIDRLVSEKAISAIASGKRSDVSRISLNLSAVTLRDEKIVSHFKRLLRRFGIVGASVLLEVTETAVLLDLEHARSTLDDFRALGIRVAIDDFGSGFASFSLLRNLRFDLLKIDRALTDGIGRNCADESILEGLIGLGHNLGVQVVAEGVESLGQCRWLESRGCDLLQGFHLGIPRPLC